MVEVAMFAVVPEAISTTSAARPPVMLIVVLTKTVYINLGIFGSRRSNIRVSMPVPTRVASISRSALRAPSWRVKESEEPVESARLTARVLS